MAAVGLAQVLDLDRGGRGHAGDHGISPRGSDGLRLHRHRLEHDPRARRRGARTGASPRCCSSARSRASAAAARRSPPAKIDEVAARGRRAGARSPARPAPSASAIVATAAHPRRRQPRRAPAPAMSAVEVEILDGDEEARLAFLGATTTLGAELPGTVGVVDVGGGSTEIVVGTLADGVHLVARRSASARASWPTATCARTRRRSAELRRACASTSTDVLEGLDVPARRRAPSRSAAARPRCAGSSAPCSTTTTLERALGVLCGAPAGEVAAALRARPRARAAAAGRHPAARRGRRAAGHAVADRPRRAARGRPAGHGS